MCLAATRSTFPCSRRPHTSLIASTYDRSFNPSRVVSTICFFRPIQWSTEAQKPSPEAIAANQRMIDVQEAMKRSRAGLDRDFGYGVEGSPDNLVRVPIRFIGERMGAKVTWNGDPGQVTKWGPLWKPGEGSAVPPWCCRTRPASS